MGSKGKEKRKAPQLDKHKSLPMPELEMGDGSVQKNKKEAK